MWGRIYGELSFKISKDISLPLGKYAPITSLWVRMRKGMMCCIFRNEESGQWLRMDLQTPLVNRGGQMPTSHHTGLLCVNLNFVLAAVPPNRSLLDPRVVRRGPIVQLAPTGSPTTP
jgi:hypothetical protein